MSFWFAFLPEPSSSPQGADTGNHAAQLAAWALQFSSQVAPLSAADRTGFLIETGASERLFGGRAALHARILEGLVDLGFPADCIAAAGAPTPAAAHAFARALSLGLLPAAIQEPFVIEPYRLRSALERLPLRATDWDAPLIDTLHGLGLATIGDVLRLPRDAFARRFGARRLTSLDRLLGTAPDPQALLLAPERFWSHEDLPVAATGTEALRIPLERMLRRLEEFLRVRNQGATALLLRTHHRPRRETALPPTAVPLGSAEETSRAGRGCAERTDTSSTASTAGAGSARAAAYSEIPLMLAAPERNAARLHSLLGERLAHARLPGATVAIELELLRMSAFASPTQDLLPPAAQGPALDGSTAMEILRLCETLHARLGSPRVFQLQTCDDHRPERAYRSAPAFVSRSASGSAAPTPAPSAQRPLWILPSPHPLQSPGTNGAPPSYGGPLALLAGPERIEAGWWDFGCPRGQAVHRDYFVARNPRGQTLWIYRERTAPRNWFLHGFFS